MLICILCAENAVKVEIPKLLQRMNLRDASIMKEGKGYTDCKTRYLLESARWVLASPSSHLSALLEGQIPRTHLAKANQSRCRPNHPNRRVYTYQEQKFFVFCFLGCSMSNEVVLRNTGRGRFAMASSGVENLRTASRIYVQNWRQHAYRCLIVSKHA